MNKVKVSGIYRNAPRIRVKVNGVWRRVRKILTKKSGIWTQNHQESYVWKYGAYGACSVTCGGGTQTRSVWCQRNDGKTVADGYCSGAKPATSQACNTQACYSYAWSIGAYGACSVTCGGGTQTRSVWCRRSDGVHVADAYCPPPKPATSQACNTQSCTTCYAPIFTYTVAYGGGYYPNFAIANGRGWEWFRSSTWATYIFWNSAQLYYVGAQVSSYGRWSRGAHYTTYTGKYGLYYIYYICYT